MFHADQRAFCIYLHRSRFSRIHSQHFFRVDSHVAVNCADEEPVEGAARFARKIARLVGVCSFQRTACTVLEHGKYCAKDVNECFRVFAQLANEAGEESGELCGSLHPLAPPGACFSAISSSARSAINFVTRHASPFSIRR